MQESTLSVLVQYHFKISILQHCSYFSLNVVEPGIYYSKFEVLITFIQGPLNTFCFLENA